MLIRIFFLFTVLILITNQADAKLNWFKEKIESIKAGDLDSLAQAKLSDTKIGEGLKEALKVGIDNAVKSTGRTDGYLKNEAIKIVIPENLSFLDKGLRMVGFGDKLDEFTVSMNRAAEQAAPFARDIFLDALFDMNISDIQGVFKGGDTAATEFFKSKTFDQLSKAFEPSVNKALNQFDVTNQYKGLVDKYQTIPFSKNLQAPDIDQYVIDKALDGLFYVLGQEEKKIRTNPSARVTALLKNVFK